MRGLVLNTVHATRTVAGAMIEKGVALAPKG
jgi:hypothetical protein